MQQVKTILFDFDGTIADTLPSCIEVANTYAEQYGVRKVKPDEIERLKGMRPFELLKEFKIPIYKVPFLIKKVQLELYEGMDKIKVFPGWKETLKELKRKGYLLGIITSNSEENVKRCLLANSVNCFDFIHNERNLFGKSRTIKNVIKQHKLNKDEVVYIGDEVRDIESAQKSQVRSIAVSWGFNSRVLLEKYNPDVILNKPQDLLTLLK